MAHDDWDSVAAPLRAKLRSSGLDSLTERELLLYVFLRLDERMAPLRYLAPRFVVPAFLLALTLLLGGPPATEKAIEALAPILRGP